MPKTPKLTLAAHLTWLTSLAVSLSATLAAAQVVNLYSARHYATDEALYNNFTKATGIKVNRIEANEDQLLERLRTEGARSPADLFLTVDAGRLGVAEHLGLFASVQSPVLNERIPAHLRLANNTWFGLSVRARVLVVDTAKVKPDEITRYEDLADPKWKGQICVRSGSYIYNLSLLSSFIEHWGVEKTEAWAKGLVANFARPPRGGDTDQVKSVGAGECSIAISNSYYAARLLKGKDDERMMMKRLRIVFPNQADRGTHVNVAGVGLLKTAPNRDNAMKLLEYLASDQAQVFFAEGNNEWPAVASTKVDNPALDAMGKFKADSLNIAVLGQHQRTAQEIVNRVGWK